MMIIQPEHAIPEMILDVKYQKVVKDVLGTGIVKDGHSLGKLLAVIMYVLLKGIPSNLVTDIVPRILLNVLKMVHPLHRVIIFVLDGKLDPKGQTFVLYKSFYY